MYNDGSYIINLLHKWFMLFNYGLFLFLQIIIMINYIRYDVMSQFDWIDVIGYCYQISILFVIDIYFCYLQLYPEHASSFHVFVGKFI
jgi:hypothetical protein